MITAVLIIGYIAFLAFVVYSGQALQTIMLLSVWGLMALSVLYALVSGLYRLIA